MRVHSSPRFIVALALTAVAACASVAPPPDPVASRALAPTGDLRVGLYPGTPTSIMGDAASGNAKGVGLDLGKALAARAGIPFKPMVFARNAEVLAAARAGSVDMVFTNATAERAQFLDFSTAIFEVEQGYLVGPGSKIGSVDQVDAAGVRVGVSEGSTSEGALTRELGNARVVRTASLAAAIDMLRTGQLDAFASNKPTLFEMSDQLAGARVLAGRYGVETFAIGIPKGRDAALPLVNAFARDAKARGVVAQVVERAGLRGTMPVN